MKKLDEFPKELVETLVEGREGMKSNWRMHVIPYIEFHGAEWF